MTEKKPVDYFCSMLVAARSASEAVERLSSHDPILNKIDLLGQKNTDFDLEELSDCLLAHPDAINYVDLGHNRLTDKTGAKLARYLAASSTIKWLNVPHNQFGAETYLGVAAALRLNSSLQVLYLQGNEAVDRARIDAAFVQALRLNPVRPVDSYWFLYSASNDFVRLKHAADQLGHPSLKMLLAAILNE